MAGDSYGQRRIARANVADVGSAHEAGGPQGPPVFHDTRRDRDRHRDGREHGFDGEDLRHQRRVAAHLARQDVGIRRRRHRGAARDHQRDSAPDSPPARAMRDRDRRHHDQLERAGRSASAAFGRISSLEPQARADDQQAERERGAAERIDEDVDRLRDRARATGLSAMPDRRRPRSAGSARSPSSTSRQSRRARRGVAHQHPHAQHIEHRRHRHHGDRGEREAEIAEQIAGDRQRHEGLPARRALEQRREGRAVDAELAREQRPQREAERGHHQHGANSVPPTASTGTLARSARAIVPISRAGNIT